MVISWAGAVAAAWVMITAVVDDWELCCGVCALGETVPCVINRPGDAACFGSSLGVLLGSSGVADTFVSTMKWSGCDVGTPPDASTARVLPAWAGNRVPSGSSPDAVDKAGETGAEI